MKCFELARHQRPITQLKINQDGDLLFTVGVDKTINMYNLLNYERYGNFQTPAACKSIDCSEDSEQIVVGCLDGLVYIYKTNGGQKLFSLTTQTFQKISYIEFSLGGQFLMMIYEWNEKTQINVVNYTELKQKFSEGDQKYKLTEQNSEEYKSFDQVLTKACWGPLNENFYASSKAGFILKYDRNFKEVQKQKAHDGEATNFCFSKDFSIIASVGSDGGKIIDPVTFQILRIFKTDVPMNAVDISPLLCEQKHSSQQRYHFIMAGGIASRDAAQSKKGGFDIHLCDIEQSEEIGTINNHFSTVNSVVFLPRGEGFISAAEEGNAKLVFFNKSYFEND